MEDRRFLAPDGAEVEAWQLTDVSRFQQKTMPEWIDSRWFMTVDNATWLDIAGDGKGSPCPDYSWLVYNGMGVTIVSAQDFESYAKVVQEAPPPDPTPAQEETLAPGNEYKSLMTELLVVLEIGAIDAADTLAALKEVVSKRVTWCNCPPGQCEGGDRWSCRTNSPLVQ